MNPILLLFSQNCGLSGLEFTKCFSELQTVKTLTRLLHQKQSDLSLHCLSRHFWLVNTARNFRSFTVHSLQAHYGKCFKIMNSFLLLFLNKMQFVRTGVPKMLVRIANSEDPDGASDLGLHCLCRPFWWQLGLKFLETLPYYKNVSLI